MNNADRQKNCENLLSQLHRICTYSSYQNSSKIPKKFALIGGVAGGGVHILTKDFSTTSEKKNTFQVQYNACDSVCGDSLFDLFQLSAFFLLLHIPFYIQSPVNVCLKGHTLNYPILEIFYRELKKLSILFQFSRKYFQIQVA